METPPRPQPQTQPYAQPPAGRRDRRRVQRRAAVQRAAELGRQYELGELVTEAEKRHGGDGRAWGCVLILLAVIPGGAFAAAAFASAGLGPGGRLITAAIPAALLAGGIALARLAPPERTDKILAYTGGLLLDAHGAAAPQVIPWVLVDDARYDYDTDDDGDPVLRGIKVSSLDGTVINLDGGLKTRGLDRLGQEIDAMIVAMRLPAATEQCAGGAPVTFGDLTVGRAGIGWDGGRQFSPWTGVRGLKMTRHEIRLETGPRRGGQVIQLSGVPDALIAILLIQDLAGRLGVPQDGRPVERPAPPSGDDRVIAARDALLTELDVSEILGRPAELVSATGGGGGFAIRIFRGDGVRLSVVRLGPGAFSGINQATGRRLGREVAGIGDRAWLVNQERTLIAVAGPATVKLSLSGLPPGAAPAALIPLGRQVIDRLATLPGGPAEAAGPAEPGRPSDWP